MNPRRCAKNIVHYPEHEHATDAGNRLSVSSSWDERDEYFRSMWYLYIVPIMKSTMPHMEVL